VADPTAQVRSGTYRRDLNRCISCGTTDGLTYHHRQASGMGGNPVRPTMPEGLTACMICNAAFEAELQTAALRFGWKVRRWVKNPARVPVFDAVAGYWVVLHQTEPERRRVPQRVAQRMMRDVYGKEVT